MDVPDPPPLKPGELAEAIWLYLRLKRDRESGYKMWQVTWDRNGIGVGSVNPRFDIAQIAPTMKSST
jgi:hypothetical protein